MNAKKDIIVLGVNLLKPTLENAFQFLNNMAETNAELEKKEIEQLYDFLGNVVNSYGTPSLKEEFAQSHELSQAEIVEVLDKLDFSQLNSNDKADVIKTTIEQNKKTGRLGSVLSAVPKIIGSVAVGAIGFILAKGEADHRKRPPTFIEAITGKKKR